MNGNKKIKLFKGDLKRPTSKDKTSQKKGGVDMPLLFLREPLSKEERLRRDWPDYLPRPTDEDIKELAKLSERNTGSAFFEKEKREGKNGDSTTFD